jgi:hypothetical protein
MATPALSVEKGAAALGASLKSLQPTRRGWSRGKGDPFARNVDRRADSDEAGHRSDLKSATWRHSGGSRRCCSCFSTWVKRAKHGAERAGSSGTARGRPGSQQEGAARATRARANQLCGAIQKTGGACLVLRNSVGNPQPLQGAARLRYAATRAPTGALRFWGWTSNLVGALNSHELAHVAGLRFIRFRHYCKQHFLYFFPLPHGHGSLRPTLLCWSNARLFRWIRFASDNANQPGGII